MRLPAVAAVLTVTGALVAAGPAGAQFGSIFGDPPRPPGSIGQSDDERYPQQFPRQPQQLPPQPQTLPPQQPQTLPPPQAQPQTLPRPGQAAQPAQPQAPRPPAGGIQSQPLAPPPGAVAAPAEPAAPPPGATPQPLPGLPPGQRQPRGTAQPGDAAPQPGDEVVTEMPSQKIANPTAVFSGLDKITGRIITFDVAINETVQFGALQVTPRVCYTRPPTEAPNTDGFAEVEEITLQGEVRRIFTGWMFAASPGLHAIEHPIYDVWLVDCKGGTAAVAAAPDQPAAPAGRQPAAKQPAAKQPAKQPAARQTPPRAQAPQAPQGPLVPPATRPPATAQPGGFIQPIR